MRHTGPTSFILFFGLVPTLLAAPPRSLDNRLTIELFAEQPQIVTPTGIDVAADGRVWVIECNTHFPPERYAGHPTDRVLILQDTNGDGRAEEPKVFAEGFTHAMSIAVRPVWMDVIRLESDDVDAAKNPEPHTQVFLATRREILLLEDIDGDDVCDRQTRLAWLETEGNYPHNGLAGFAFDACGTMYFGFGENLGADYTLRCRSSDDNAESGQNAPLKGGGEGGNMYRMGANGRGLQHWATGFWNPHASCVDAFGRLFTVDNDPDSRPPCRLLHIIEEGDYGFRFRNGRKGLHPFTSWNGEIPGTLPMVAGTGEAPSGILAYEHGAFPEEYLGNLLVTSWGDHRIDRFRLQPKGASFESIAEPVIVGDDDFRPVGIALAPDGALYCTDWVMRDYKVHGHGRIWRIQAKDESQHRSPDFGAIPNMEDVAELRQLLQNGSLPVRRLAARRLSTIGGKEELREIRSTADERARIELAAVPGLKFRLCGNQSLYTTLWFLRVIDPVSGDVREFDIKDISDPFWIQETVVSASSPLSPYPAPIDRDHLRLLWDAEAPFREWGRYPDENRFVVATLVSRQRFPRDEEFIKRAFSTNSTSVRRLAVQWVAEERLTQFRPQVEAILKSDDMTSNLFLATLAALEMLDGKAPQDFDKTPPGKYVLPLLADANTPAAVKRQALRLIDPADPALTTELLEPMLRSENQQLRLEVLRTLAGSPLPEAAKWLSEAAVQNDKDRGVERMTAITGLAAHMNSDVARQTLVDLLSSPLADKPDVFRSLRELAGQDDEIKRRIVESVSERTGQASAWSEIDAQLALLPGGPTVDGKQFLLPNAPVRPASDKAWFELFYEEDSTASAFAGEQVFFHPNGPGCFKCHTVDGRGGRIGPDLTSIGLGLHKSDLVAAILKPSKEVSPQFTTWNMATHDGRTLTGMLVYENLGETTLGNEKGELTTIQTVDIEARTPVKTSVMPEKLEDRMTVREFQNLIEFLANLK
ncbi:MAG: c-type cytochrome [Planctomycetaceae bacterium]